MTGRIKATRAESQWIVAARPLCHLQYPSYLSRLQRILPAARWVRFRRLVGLIRERGSPAARCLWGQEGPYLLVGKRTWAGTCVASCPDSDLEAFSPLIQAPR
ncbi:hypothetical protein HKD37_U058672 [Glycine soja]